jgi:hypothetical protein
MGGACGTYGGKGEVVTSFWWGDLRDRNYFEDLGIDGRIFKWISNKWDEEA